MFQIGDKIIILAKEQIGIIKDIDFDNQLIIESNQKTFTISQEEICLLPQYQFFNKNENHSELEFPKIEEVEKRLFLCFIPIFKEFDYEHIVDYFKVYLLNQTSQKINFIYIRKNNKKEIFSLDGEIIISQNLYLENILWDKLSENLCIEINWAFTPNTKKLATQIPFSYKPKGKEIIEQVEKILLQDKTHFLIPIPENDILEKPEPLPEWNIIKKSFFQKPTNKQTNKVIKRAHYIIDLHIEKILPNFKHLSNYEILQIQLNHAEQNIDLAFREGLHSIILVHGLGTGKLKTELHFLLKKINYIKKFSNNYHPLFGFGATEIFF